MNKILGFTLLIIIVLVVVVLIKPQQQAITEESYEEYSEDKILDIIKENLISGGPPKDGIPAIDNPKYINADETNLKPEDQIFGIVNNEQAYAYPRRILYWHEIVNEEFNGEKHSITFCPLTGTIIGYKDVNLGVSGALYNSNLVTYDRETDALIPQIIGQAIDTEIKGKKLETFPVIVTTWEKWKTKYPNTLVLSEDTGIERDYNKNPYPGYENLLRVWFPLAAEDNRFHSKKIVTGIENNGEFLAIPKEDFKGQTEIQLGGETLTVTYNKDLDIIEVPNADKYFDSYWFAWYAYYPTTEVLNLK